jgi:glyoxylase-like metal-dependent hydrolase (beta-lactamase superfamily II)
MWISHPGKISPEIDYLGNRKHCIYLLKGQDAMLIGGGMSWIAPELEKQFASLDFPPERIRYLLIPHSHFDHCGAVPFIRRRFPAIQILGTAYAQRVLANPKAIAFIAAQNQRMIEFHGLEAQAQRWDLKFEAIPVERVVKEGDRIDLGDGIEAEFFEVPGHTQCAVAVYVPKLKALFPTDAAPFPTEDGKEPSFPSPQYHYPLYLSSLEKLASLPVQICGFEHHGALVGKECQSFLQQGLEKAKGLKALFLREYQKTGNLDEVARHFALESRSKNHQEFMSLEVHTQVMKTVIQKVLGDALPSPKGDPSPSRL